jgi:hypothetical protein
VGGEVEQIAGLEIIRLAIDEKPDRALMDDDELIMVVAVMTVICAWAILPGEDAESLAFEALPQFLLRTAFEFALLKR